MVVRLAKIQPDQGASHVLRRYWEVRLVSSVSRKQISLMFTADDLWIKTCKCLQADHCRGGRDSAYERGGDARWKFWIKPLKETDLGVAQAFFDP